MRLAICGHGQHGKGTVAQWLANNTKLRYWQSTSEAAAALVFSKIGRKYGYLNRVECFQDRRNHRAEWAEIIWSHNQPHGVTLYQEMLADSDIIEGIRRADELAACKRLGIIDYSIWVDAGARMPPEDESSCKIRAGDCHFCLNNNLAFEHTAAALKSLCRDLGIQVLEPRRRKAQ